MAAGVATAGASIAAITSAVMLALRLDAMRPLVEVRLWARPGVYGAKLCDDFDTFRSTLAAAAGVDRATIRLYYFRGPVIVADRVAITDAASLRAFEAAHRAVWVYEPAAATAGPPSPDELPAAPLPDAPAPVRSAHSGSSSQQECFRAGLLKRDGAACVLCGLADDVGGKSCLEAAHVIASSTPERILDEIPLINTFDMLNGIVLCANCHHWYGRHMWHADADGNARVADALRHRVGASAGRHSTAARCASLRRRWTRSGRCRATGQSNSACAWPWLRRGPRSSQGTPSSAMRAARAQRQRLACVGTRAAPTRAASRHS